jgi:hypothetical protein
MHKYAIVQLEVLDDIIMIRILSEKAQFTARRKRQAEQNHYIPSCLNVLFAQDRAVPLVLHLSLDQLYITPPTPDQLVVTPLFLDPTVLDNMDDVSLTDGTQPVSDGDRGPSFRGVCQSLIDLEFGSGIQSRGSLFGM